MPYQIMGKITGPTHNIFYRGASQADAYRN